jgi:hypothetical protein
MTEIRKSFVTNKCVHILKVVLERYQHNEFISSRLKDIYERFLDIKDRQKSDARKNQFEPIIDEELKQLFNELDFFLKSNSPHRALGFVLAAYPKETELLSLIKEFNGDIYEDIIFERNLFNDILFDDRMSESVR